MAAVGLLFVGAVLIVNGLMLLGYVDARSAAPLNLFVGAMQVVTPTFLIFTAAGPPAVRAATVLFASGLYLFGFTYLYVGINLLGNLDGTGLGWYSLFVTFCAITFAAVNFWGIAGIAKDPAFTAIWLYWAVLWALFWVVLGLKREEWTRYTGAIAVVAGVVTAAAPGFLLLTGKWTPYDRSWTVGLAIVLGLSLVASIPLRTRYQPAVPPAAPVPEGAPQAPEGLPVARGPVTQEAGQGTHRAG
jgi:putative amide transporter protein